MLLLCFRLRLRAERGLALIERLCKSGVKAAHYDPCILSRRLKLNIHQIKWQFSIQIYFRSESSSFKTFPFRPSMPMPPPHLRISYFWFTQNCCSSFGLCVWDHNLVAARIALDYCLWIGAGFFLEGEGGGSYCGMLIQTSRYRCIYSIWVCGMLIQISRAHHRHCSTCWWLPHCSQSLPPLTFLACVCICICICMGSPFLKRGFPICICICVPVLFMTSTAHAAPSIFCISNP